ncbi:MAG TPA: type II toxin-antitoxin system RelE/ParE family toxin [Ktedonobacteraceae bacterium]|nr:type II toxin-antitoxin system RelE/ParE family toxin [Ktedonobacteraceae bacterium]
MKRWVVSLTREAYVQLLAISDRRIQESIQKRINRLEDEPEKQGKPMRDELSGFRSIRAVGQRYRIIYKVEEAQVTVVVVTLGIRKDGDKKDVYELAKRLMRLGLLDRE